MSKVTFLLVVGCIAVGAVPFYGSGFDGSETEFVPLEQQGRSGNPNVKDEKPFEVDVITSDVGGNRGPIPVPNGGGLFFQHAFPSFFTNDFFNAFGGFDIGPQQEPWWKGPNVCTDKTEDEAEDVKHSKKQKNDSETTDKDTEEIAPGISETVEVRPPLLGQFHFSLNSCVDKPNKYICTRIVNKNGKKKTVTITRQCCRGYGRSRNADYGMPCEKMELKSFEATAMENDGKEFIAGAKSNGLTDMIANRKNMTIFMPIDSAFTNYNEQMQNSINTVESKEDGTPKSIYLLHIVDGEMFLDDLRNEQLLKSNVDGQTIRINTYQLPPSLSAEPLRYTANCVPIEKHDKQTEQGLMHMLGGVMRPVSKTVMDLIRERPDMSIMRTVLENTKLNELLEGDNSVTIFVPTDDAFEKLEPHLRRALKEGKVCAANILKNHILDLTFCSVASIPGAKTTAFNLLGEPMRFNRSKLMTEKSEVADMMTSNQPIVINGLAKITEADIMGTNGVMHVIDTILPTQSALPMSSLMQEKNVTIFKRLLEASGMDYRFDDMDNVTVFAPTNKAMQGTKWAQMLESSPDMLKDNTELMEFINYHVAKPMTKTCDLSEQLMPTVAGPKLRINLYSTNGLFANVMNRATANCAMLVHFDDETCGSVLHQVDKVLAPPKKNLLEELENNPNYSRFLELIRAANLTSLLSNNEESYTLLLPKNDVFDEVDDWEKSLTKNKDDLENLVKTHIVNDVVCCAGIVPKTWPFIRTIETLNGHHLRINRERRPKIENAGVTKCDHIAVNGIIHEINDIIVPINRQQRPSQYPLQHPIEEFDGSFF